MIYERVTVPYAEHTIPTWTQGEKCAGCRKKAAHKVEETSGPETFHPLTAYLCCQCFQLIGHCATYPYDADHHFTRSV